MRILPAVSTASLQFSVPPILRRVRWLVAVLVTALAARAATDEWRYVRTPHFDLLSQASEKKTRQLVTDLEQFRASFLSTFALRPAHEARVTVVLFDSKRRFTPYMPQYQGKPKEVDGYFVGGADEAVIALNLDVEIVDGFSPAETILHEYVHMLLHSRGLTLPTWLNEGMAELFSTFQVEGNKVAFGRPKQGYVNVLGLSSLMPMAHMMAVTEESPDYNEENKAGMFYAQAWALTHFLVCGEDRTNVVKLSKYVAAVGNMADREAAFRESFGITSSQMEQKLREYLQGGRYYVRREPVPVKDLATTLAIRPATELERELTLANLKWRASRAADAALVAHQLAAKFPSSPRPQEMLGIISAADGDTTAALDHWRKAAELGSDNPFTLVQAARAKLLDLGGVMDPEERLSPENTAMLRGWLQRAAQLSPLYDDPWEVMAHVESRAPEFNIAIVNQLQQRVGQMKEPGGALLGLAVVRWRVKDRETANSIIKLVADSTRARADVKMLAHLLQTRFAEDAARAGNAPQASVVQAAPATAPENASESETRVTVPLPRPNKAGVVQRPAPPPRVQYFALPTEAVAIAGASVPEKPLSDEDHAARVAEAIAKGADAPVAVLYRAVATYPKAQRREGIAGEAKVRFTVDETGRPGKVREGGSSVPDFGKAAVECVQQWRFLPAIKDGKAVSTPVELTLTFSTEGLGK